MKLWSVVKWHWLEPLDSCEWIPGHLVRGNGFPGSLGIIVSTVGEYHAVLWSIEPSREFTIMEHNAKRQHLAITNKSPHPLFIKMGSKAGPKNYDLLMEAHTVFEMNNYLGPIAGYWEDEVGELQITEMS